MKVSTFELRLEKVRMILKILKITLKKNICSVCQGVLFVVILLVPKAGNDTLILVLSLIARSDINISYMYM